MNEVHLFARNRQGEELHVHAFETNRKYPVVYERRVKYMPSGEMQQLAQAILTREKLR